MVESADSIKVLVLIADDDSDTRDLLKIALRLKEYAIIEVSDGREMIERAKIERPGLIIADIMMPHIDGHEGIRMLREDPAFQNIPVLFISCIISGEAIVSQLKNMSRCAFLEKPFDHKALLETIEKLLNRR